MRVRGHTVVPPTLLARFSILCAILRQLHLLLQIHLTGELSSTNPRAYFVDQLSAGLPLLQALHPRGRVLFYCHFPDLLLAQGRRRWWKRAYRLPFDWWEQWSMSFADVIAVNSNFTRGVVSRTWPALARTKDLKIVYPCVDTKPEENKKKDRVQEEKDAKPLWNGKKFLLSINRFERKKDIALAIHAFAGLKPAARQGVRLVLAGGYDPRVAENVGYHKELVSLTETLGLRAITAGTHPTALEVPDDVEVLFLHSVPHLLKAMLLASARLLVYTPANEHFGIVPLEAMLAGCPVLAADTGGPRETVVEGRTGWLRSPAHVGRWTDVMDKVLNRMSEPELEAMRQAGVDRVKGGFGQEQMAQRLDEIVQEMLEVPGTARARAYGPLWVLTLGVLGILGGVVAVVLKGWSRL